MLHYRITCPLGDRGSPLSVFCAKYSQRALLTRVLVCVRIYMCNENDVPGVITFCDHWNIIYSLYLYYHIFMHCQYEFKQERLFTLRMLCFEDRACELLSMFTIVNYILLFRFRADTYKCFAKNALVLLAISNN